jgi:hypothetical protein
MPLFTLLAVSYPGHGVPPFDQKNTWNNFIGTCSPVSTSGAGVKIIGASCLLPGKKGLSQARNKVPKITKIAIFTKLFFIILPLKPYSAYDPETEGEGIAHTSVGFNIKGWSQKKTVTGAKTHQWPARYVSILINKRNSQLVLKKEPREVVLF